MKKYLSKFEIIVLSLEVAIFLLVLLEAIIGSFDEKMNKKIIYLFIITVVLFIYIKRHIKKRYDLEKHMKDSFKISFGEIGLNIYEAKSSIGEIKHIINNLDNKYITKINNINFDNIKNILSSKLKFYENYQNIVPLLAIVSMLNLAKSNDRAILLLTSSLAMTFIIAYTEDYFYKLILKDIFFKIDTVNFILLHQNGKEQMKSNRKYLDSFFLV